LYESASCAGFLVSCDAFKAGFGKPQVFGKNLAGTFTRVFALLAQFLQVFPKFVDYKLFSDFYISFDCILNNSVLKLHLNLPYKPTKTIFFVK